VRNQHRRPTRLFPRPCLSKHFRGHSVLLVASYLFWLRGHKILHSSYSPAHPQTKTQAPTTHRRCEDSGPGNAGWAQRQLGSGETTSNERSKSKEGGTSVRRTLKQNKKRRTPVHLLNPRRDPPTRRLFFLLRFGAFLGKGSSKTPLKYFCKKSMSKTFSNQIDKNYDVSFSSSFFCVIAFSGFSAMGVLQKNSCRKKLLRKNRPKSKTVFFSIFFITFWGVSR
jgi:hypothetical protein